MALKITGQLTTQDYPIGDNNIYLRFEYNHYCDNRVIINTNIFKSKQSYKDWKPFPPVNEILQQYEIKDIPPQSGFNSLAGKSLQDKYLYWLHEKVKAAILLVNPSFVITIEDIDL